MRSLRAVPIAVVLALAMLPIPGMAGSTDEGFFLVRFQDRITDAARSDVAATGVTIIDYEPRDSYIVWGGGAQASRAADVAAVREVAPLPLARKLHPSIGGDGTMTAGVTVYRPAAGAAAARLGLLGEAVTSMPTGRDLTTLVVRAPASALRDAAADPAVLHVGPAPRGLFPEDEATDQIVAGNIDRGTNRPVTGYAEWLAARDLDGEGVKAAVVDTGVQALHPDLLLRVEKPVDYMNPAEPADTLGHGTHVAGIIGGAPPAGILPRDPDGFVYGIGVAPAVGLVDLNAIGLASVTGAFSHRNNLDVIARDALEAGAEMWNASWHTGEGSRVGYTASTRMMDVLSRDADLSTPGSEEFLFVFSAGNAGGNGPTVPKEAKNIISVGSTQSGRGLAWPLTSNIDAVSSFSSKGPAQDGRVFPVVSAPGENVMSARAPEGALTATCVPPADGAGLYASCSGTSMAAPHVTGAAALIHQWWERETGELPSPAMVKALLVNGATDVGAQNIPNNNEGWGRIDLGNVFAGLPRTFDDQETVFGEPGQEVSHEIEVDGSGPFKTTLSWSDAPAAEGANPTLVNDLDLIVELLDEEGETVQTWLGNEFLGGESVPGGTPDRLNNVENVFLKAPQTGTYRVTVRAHDVPGDGIPHNEDPTDQDFALVIR